MASASGASARVLHQGNVGHRTQSGVLNACGMPVGSAEVAQHTYQRGAALLMLLSVTATGVVGTSAMDRGSSPKVQLPAGL
jgi:hypothetical protein